MANALHSEPHVYREPQPTPAAFLRRVSWGAILAGLFVAGAVQILLTLLGASIGAATIDPLREQNPTKGLGMGSAIWFGLSALIAVWAGSWVAGRLSGGPRRMDGLLHGVVTWSLSTVVMLALLTSAVGALLGGTASLMSNALRTPSGQAAAGEAAQQLQNVLPQAGALTPTGRSQGGLQPGGQLTQLATQDPELGAALARMVAKGGAVQAPEARDQVLTLLSSRHNMDQAQASALLNQWDQQSQATKAQGEQKLRQAGETAAKGVSQGALYAFIALLLGLLAAAWGGWLGTAALPRYGRTELQEAAA